MPTASLMLELTASLSLFASRAMTPCTLPLNVFQRGASYGILLLRDSQRLYLHTPNPRGIGLETAGGACFRTYNVHVRTSANGDLLNSEM